MASQYPKEIQNTLEALKANCFDARLAQNIEEANKMMLEMIPPTASVGIGDSVTLRQTAIIAELIQRGNKVINPFEREISGRAANRRLFMNLCRQALNCDVFTAGANAVTEDGKLVCIDKTGNRVAGIIYGADRIILVLGRNKIVKDTEAAINRIKNVLAPMHTQTKGYTTPCTVKGQCMDCRTAERICNITVILEKKPANSDYTVILINQDLGLGWDPAWDVARVNAIIEDYRKHTWAFFKE